MWQTNSRTSLRKTASQSTQLAGLQHPPNKIYSSILSPMLFLPSNHICMPNHQRRIMKWISWACSQTAGCWVKVRETKCTSLSSRWVSAATARLVVLLRRGFSWSKRARDVSLKDQRHHSATLLRQLLRQHHFYKTSMRAKGKVVQRVWLVLSQEESKHNNFSSNSYCKKLKTKRHLKTFKTHKSSCSLMIL